MKRVDSIYNKRKEHNDDIYFQIRKYELLIMGGIKVIDNMIKIKELKSKIW